MDKDLKALRNGRWDKAFKTGDSSKHVDENKADEVNRKATIVIEHIIQASDISHTMQHWHIYRKWNRRLFEELYAAYKTGRSESNPADFWAKGEIGFLTFTVSITVFCFVVLLALSLSLSLSLAGFICLSTVANFMYLTFYSPRSFSSNDVL